MFVFLPRLGCGLPLHVDGIIGTGSAKGLNMVDDITGATPTREPGGRTRVLALELGAGGVRAGRLGEKRQGDNASDEQS